MPIELERALRKAAKKQGYTGSREDDYVYGTLNKRKKKKKRYKTDMNKTKDVE